METRIEIRWDGSDESFAHHRMSLELWQEALAKLLSAIRRTASSIVTKDEQPSLTGRVAEEAASIDVELEAITQGSTGVAAVVTTRRPDLFGTLPAKATQRFVEDLQNEERGIHVNPAARSYLRRVPSTVTQHEYTVLQGSTVLVQAKLKRFTEDEFDENLPAVYRSSAVVTAVSFKPLGVSLQFPIGKVRATATREQVECAIENHEVELVASVVSVDGKYRLVGLSKDSKPRLSPASRIEKISNDWKETLARLAQ